MRPRSEVARRGAVWPAGTPPRLAPVLSGAAGAPVIRKHRPSAAHRTMPSPDLLLAPLLLLSDRHEGTGWESRRTLRRARRPRAGHAAGDRTGFRRLAGA